MELLTHSTKETHVPWNKGKLIGQKAQPKLKDIWAIRIHLQMARRIHDRSQSGSKSCLGSISGSPHSP